MFLCIGALHYKRKGAEAGWNGEQFVSEPGCLSSIY